MYKFLIISRTRIWLFVQVFDYFTYAGLCTSIGLCISIGLFYVQAFDYFMYKHWIVLRTSICLFTSLELFCVQVLFCGKVQMQAQVKALDYFITNIEMCTWYWIILYTYKSLIILCISTQTHVYTQTSLNYFAL